MQRSANMVKKFYASIIGLIFYLAILLTAGGDIFILFSLPATLFLNPYHGDYYVDLYEKGSSIESTLWLVFTITSAIYYLYVLLIGIKGRQTSMFVFII